MQEKVWANSFLGFGGTYLWHLAKKSPQHYSGGRESQRSSERVKEMSVTSKQAKRQICRSFGMNWHALTSGSETQQLRDLKLHPPTISLDHPRLLLESDHQPPAEWLTSVPQLHFQYDSVLNSISMMGQRGSDIQEKKNARVRVFQVDNQTC